MATSFDEVAAVLRGNRAPIDLQRAVAFRAGMAVAPGAAQAAFDLLTQATDDPGVA